MTRSCQPLTTGRRPQPPCMPRTRPGRALPWQGRARRGRCSTGRTGAAKRGRPGAQSHLAQHGKAGKAEEVPPRAAAVPDAVARTQSAALLDALLPLEPMAVSLGDMLASQAG